MAVLKVRLECANSEKHGETLFEVEDLKTYKTGQKNHFAFKIVAMVVACSLKGAMLRTGTADKMQQH